MKSSIGKKSAKTKKRVVRSILPKGVRLIIYSYLNGKELCRICCLSKTERAMIPKSKLLNQERKINEEWLDKLMSGLGTFRKVRDRPKMNFVIDLCSHLPKKIVVKRRDQFMEYLNII